MTEKVLVPPPGTARERAAAAGPCLQLSPARRMKDNDALVPQGTTRRIHVSLDQGETWNMAQLPSVGHEQFYSILAANDDLVFMHVDEPGGEWHWGQGRILGLGTTGNLCSKPASSSPEHRALSPCCSSSAVPWRKGFLIKASLISWLLAPVCSMQGP